MKQTLFGPAAPLTANTTPYGGFFVLGALYRHGQARLAEDYMRRYWAPMLQDPTGTLWEHFERSAGSSSHAWSAAPTYYLSTEVLGVQLGYPLSEGLEPVTISPHAESLSWARGVVPHPSGDIAVDWRADDQVLHLSVRAPPGLRYRVVPRGRLGALRLELNGRMIERLPAEGP